MLILKLLELKVKTHENRFWITELFSRVHQKLLRWI